MSKQKSISYNPYFLLYGREPILPSSIQHSGNGVIEPQDEGANKIELLSDNVGAVLRGAPMHYLTSAQQRDRARFRHEHEAGCAKPRALFVGGLVILNQPKGDTLDPRSRRGVRSGLQKKRWSVRLW